jgi:gliding motility-associated-like protein
LDQFIRVYEIMPLIAIDNGPSICIDDVINFSQVIIDETGRATKFRWESDEFGTQEEGVFSVEFPESGIFDIDLVYSLENGNCENRITQTIEVIPPPIADMITSVDGEFPICYPKIIEFTNTSAIVGSSTVKWVFDDETEIRNNDNPTFSFDKGTHTVDLIIKSFYGCADTIRRTFDLVSPEGTFDIDNIELCFGDQFTVMLNNDTVDVYSYIWDMGDGTRIENQNPVTHTYNYNPGPDGNRSTIDLILRAAEEGCETIYSVPVEIFEVLAKFEIDTLSSLCGEVSVINTSLGGNSYEWYLDGQLISTEENPTVEFPTEITELDLQLVLTDEASGCVSDTIITLDVNDGEYDFSVPNVFSPNGDLVNDFFDANVVTKFGSEVEITNFKIYNRWGNLIYNNSNPMGWDGRYKSEPVPSDVYAYYIEVLIADCFTETMKGNVTVVR